MRKWIALILVFAALLMPCKALAQEAEEPHYYIICQSSEGYSMLLLTMPSICFWEWECPLMSFWE